MALVSIWDYSGGGEYQPEIKAKIVDLSTLTYNQATFNVSRSLDTFFVSGFAVLFNIVPGRKKRVQATIFMVKECNIVI